MVYVFKLTKINPEVLNHLDEHPLIDGEDRVEPHSIIECKYRWVISDADEADLGPNVTNWQSLVQQIDETVKPKNEDDLNKIILLSNTMPNVLEARRVFLETCSGTKGMGPKRMELMRKMTSIWVPYIKSVKTDIQSRINHSNYDKNWSNRDRIQLQPSKWDNKSNKDRQFVRWVKI